MKPAHPTVHDKYLQQLIKRDSYLTPYAPILRRRYQHIQKMSRQLISDKTSLTEIATGYLYFGLHFENQEWVLREWAPNATAIYIISDINGWREQKKYALQRMNTHGIWEIRLPKSTFAHGDQYKLMVHWPDGKGERIPSYARRVIQDPHTHIFSAQVWSPNIPYSWKHPNFKASTDPAMIYEAHVGMAQEEPRIGTYAEFTKNILPRIAASGYNTVQLMAIQEHPYYGSFGYHVSNFFAASSRFGTPEELKQLIDTAHGYGLAVIMDIVHSHAVNNEIEGLSCFDGTLFQYFHNNPRGHHVAWDSRCFDYGKPEVIHFLLSNCKFWLDEYNFDGFRFDGITSMLYLDHGLEKAFTSYEDYFGANVDEDALTYLALANQLIHDYKPHAITVAEDISGMPGLAVPIPKGGYGFDYRMAMGIPDFWIKLTKDVRDEDWSMGQLWYELNNRRQDEKTISYTESHDQALVGDKTLIFRMIDAAMYDHMHISSQHIRVDRGMALHKMIRLITLATAGNGYLNFMGNEFGHPEWIDFPRIGNNWSYHYARRQWQLADNPDLKYALLNRFDKDILAIAKNYRLLYYPEIPLRYEHNDDKVIVFQRGSLLFAFNFHPTQSYTDYAIDTPSGTYRLICDTDREAYGGHKRLLENQTYVSFLDKYQRSLLSLYLPSRTALILELNDECR